jgi:hypothetical protein
LYFRTLTGNAEILVQRHLLADNRFIKLKAPYDSDEDLDEIVSELLSDIACDADDRHCFSESEARMEGTDRHWLRLS